MLPLNRNATVLSLASLLLAVGCASGPVSPDDRDTTGAYDGIWVGEVSGPRAKRELLPGNWYMSCDWEPHEIYLTVDGGQVRLGPLEDKSPVASDGRFHIDVSTGPAGSHGGSLAGNATYTLRFAGRLSGDEPRGRYSHRIASLGATGCSARIDFKRYEQGDA